MNDDRQPGQHVEEMKDRTIPEYFADVVTKTPQAIAVSSDVHVFTYSALEQVSNQIAHIILQHARSEDNAVILMIGRSAMAIVGILAILKSGKICIPLHPVNNEARMLDSVLNDHQDPIILTNSSGAEFAAQFRSSLRVINMETLPKEAPTRPPEVSPKAANPAFVIYTSGSTGVPKGAIHSHQNILSRVTWYIHRFKISENDRTMMLSSADSISGIVGMMRPLLTGGECCVFSIRKVGFEGMTRTIKEKRITILPIVNSVFRHFIDTVPDMDQISSVRMIILGGEFMTIGDVERYRKYFSKRCILLNTLGCTELPTYRYYVIDHHTEIEDGKVPAGHEVPGNEVDIINEDGCSLARGMTGEIVVRSKDLALGYWNQPDETKKQFFYDTDRRRCYRTGDLGRLRQDGLLEYLGRKDSQVKILGNRIELAEIENALREHPKIVNAAVGIWSTQPESSQLYANVVYKIGGRPNDSTEIKRFLRSLLPDYMVPVEFISVSSLPLTRTGKVNRRALITPEKVVTSGKRISVGSQFSELEKRIAEICGQVLQLDTVDLQDNFFDLGANSLSIFQIINRVKRHFAVKLPVVYIFSFPTVKALSKFIESSNSWNEN